jgi:ABC-type uncharacterized transport system fused permease/ATPase subunit
MEVLSRELTDATVVSIGHRTELVDFHHRKIFLLRRHGGATLVSYRRIPDKGAEGCRLARALA